MLAFVTSLRARALAQDWDHIVWLLNRCLESMLNQTCAEWQAYVVCHDVPEIAQNCDSRIKWLVADIPLPVRTNADMVTDKVIKTSIAVEAAIEAGATHVMPVDADDLVSRRLAGHVMNHTEGPGWLVENGYSHHYGSAWVQPLNQFHRLCGTCNIVAASLITFENWPEFRKARTASIVGMGHAAVAEHFEKSGMPLKSLPFPGAVYIQHCDNTSNVDRFGERSSVAGVRSWISMMKHVFMGLLASRVLTNSQRAEFNLPSPHEVPAQWRASWWRV